MELKKSGATTILSYIGQVFFICYREKRVRKYSIESGIKESVYIILQMLRYSLDDSVGAFSSLSFLDFSSNCLSNFSLATFSCNFSLR